MPISAVGATLSGVGGESDPPQTAAEPWSADGASGALQEGLREHELQDRHTERLTLGRLLTTFRGGHSQVLVIRGEAGIGKSSLLRYVMQNASGCRVAHAAGSEYEMELPYAGLHQLCVPMLGLVERLPGPQRDALEAAFGLSARASSDRFIVGLAVLSLLSEAAAEQPLLCVIDDAHWLDSESALILAFVARRLLAESIGVVFAVREPSAIRELDGLPELRLGGLVERDARELLDSAWPGRLDEQVRDRVIAESRGNPLALLELPRDLTPAELAGGFELPSVAPLTVKIERSFVRQLEPLPDDTRRLLLTAAAEPVGDLALLWQAASRLGLGADAVGPAQDAGLIELRGRVRFRHPLVRSAIYQAATAAQRQEVHRVLAEATDPETEPDRRAWHRGHATPSPDESVALELERSALRARARGGIAAAASFLERAAELSPDSGSRGRRALAAAQARFESGALDTAGQICLRSLRRAICPTRSAHGLPSSAPGSFSRSDVAVMLRPCCSTQPGISSHTTRMPVVTVTSRRWAPRSSPVVSTRASTCGTWLRAARVAPPSRRPPRLTDLLLDGLATRFNEGYVAGMAPLRRALDEAGRNADGDDDEFIRGSG